MSSDQIEWGRSYKQHIEQNKLKKLEALNSHRKRYCCVLLGLRMGQNYLLFKIFYLLNYRIEEENEKMRKTISQVGVHIDIYQ